MPRVNFPPNESIICDKLSPDVSQYSCRLHLLPADKQDAKTSPCVLWSLPDCSVRLCVSLFGLRAGNRLDQDTLAHKDRKRGWKRERWEQDTQLVQRGGEVGNIHVHETFLFKTISDHQAFPGFNMLVTGRGTPVHSLHLHNKSEHIGGKKIYIQQRQSYSNTLFLRMEKHKNPQILIIPQCNFYMETLCLEMATHFRLHSPSLFIYLLYLFTYWHMKKNLISVHCTTGYWF